MVTSAFTHRKSELNIAAAVDPGSRRETPCQIVDTILSQAPEFLFLPGLARPVGEELRPHESTTASGWRADLCHRRCERICQAVYRRRDGVSIQATVRITPLTEPLKTGAFVNRSVGIFARAGVRNRQFTACKQLAWVLRVAQAAFAAINACRLVPWLANRVIANVTLPTSGFCSEGLGNTRAFASPGWARPCRARAITQDDAAAGNRLAGTVTNRGQPFRHCIAERGSANGIARSGGCIHQWSTRHRVVLCRCGRDQFDRGPNTRLNRYGGTKQVTPLATEAARVQRIRGDTQPCEISKLGHRVCTGFCFPWCRYWLGRRT